MLGSSERRKLMRRACRPPRVLIVPLVPFSHQDPAGLGEDPATAPLGTFSHAFARALTALLPRQLDTLSSEELLCLLLAAHHPAITAGLADKRLVWLSVQRRLRSATALLASNAEPLVDRLAGDEGLASSSAASQVAAQLAMGSLFRLEASAVFDAVSVVLQGLLARGPHDALSGQEVDVWATPAGMLSSERVPDGVYVPEVVVSKNIRKPRGRFKVGRLHWPPWGFAALFVALEL